MYLTRLTGKDLPSLCTRPALLAAGLIGSLLAASMATAQDRWQAITDSDSIWALSQAESTLPWVWSERIQAGVLPGRLTLGSDIPANSWLMPYRPTLANWVEVPYRSVRTEAGDVTYRLLRYPGRPPLRLPETVPLLPARDYLYSNAELFLWSGSLEPAIGDVMLLEPGASSAGSGDSLWVTGITGSDGSIVYFLAPGFVTPPEPIGESGFRVTEGIGQVDDQTESLTRVSVRTDAAEVSVGHRVIRGAVDDRWDRDSPVHFPDRVLGMDPVIPLDNSAARRTGQSITAGKEVGLQVGVSDGIEAGQAWRLVRPGITRYDPLRQSSIQYPDQTIAHILTLRVYDNATIAFILSGSVPPGVSLLLEPA